MSVVMESYTRVKDAEAARESVLRERNDSHAIVKRLARQRWKASMADTLAGLHKDAAHMGMGSVTQTMARHWG